MFKRTFKYYVSYFFKQSDGHGAGAVVLKMKDEKINENNINLIREEIAQECQCDEIVILGIFRIK